MFDVNSVPLSLCNINEAPKTMNTLYNVLATSVGLLLLGGLVQENLAKWSCIWQIRVSHVRKVNLLRKFVDTIGLD